MHNVPTITNYMPCGGAYRCQSVRIGSRTCGSAVKFQGVFSSSVSIDSRQLREGG